MSNPVAWRKVVGNVTKHYQYNEMGEGEPLYTHPVKQLSDEEIYKIANQIEKVQPQFGLRLSNDLNVMDFARAIIKEITNG